MKNWSNLGRVRIESDVSAIFTSSNAFCSLRPHKFYVIFSPLVQRPTHCGVFLNEGIAIPSLYIKALYITKETCILIWPMSEY
jgi:hypothetical protein